MDDRAQRRDNHAARCDTDRDRASYGERYMTERQYVMQFVWIFLGSCPFIIWGFINMYLDRRDRKRDQSHE